MSDTPINCRSKLAPDCYHGKHIDEVFGPEEDMPDWHDDGTYDPDTDSIVCDPCYIALGQPAIDIRHPDAPTFGRSIDQGDPRDA